MYVSELVAVKEIFLVASSKLLLRYESTGSREPIIRERDNILYCVLLVFKFKTFVAEKHYIIILLFTIYYYFTFVSSNLVHLFILVTRRLYDNCLY